MKTSTVYIPKKTPFLILKWILYSVLLINQVYSECLHDPLFTYTPKHCYSNVEFYDEQGQRSKLLDCSSGCVDDREIPSSAASIPYVKTKCTASIRSPHTADSIENFMSSLVSGQVPGKGQSGNISTGGKGAGLQWEDRKNLKELLSLVKDMRNNGCCCGVEGKGRTKGGKWEDENMALLNKIDRLDSILGHKLGLRGKLREHDEIDDISLLEKLQHRLKNQYGKEGFKETYRKNDPKYIEKMCNELKKRKEFEQKAKENKEKGIKKDFDSEDISSLEDLGPDSKMQKKVERRKRWHQKNESKKERESDDSSLGDELNNMFSDEDKSKKEKSNQNEDEASKDKEAEISKDKEKGTLKRNEDASSISDNDKLSTDKINESNLKVKPEIPKEGEISQSKHSSASKSTEEKEQKDKETIKAKNDLSPKLMEKIDHLLQIVTNYFERCLPCPGGNQPSSNIPSQMTPSNIGQPLSSGTMGKGPEVSLPDPSKHQQNTPTSLNNALKSPVQEIASGPYEVPSNVLPPRIMIESSPVQNISKAPVQELTTGLLDVQSRPPQRLLMIESAHNNQHAKVDLFPPSSTPTSETVNLSTTSDNQIAVSPSKLKLKVSGMTLDDFKVLDSFFTQSEVEYLISNTTPGSYGDGDAINPVIRYIYDNPEMIKRNMENSLKKMDTEVTIGNYLTNLANSVITKPPNKKFPQLVNQFVSQNSQALSAPAGPFIEQLRSSIKHIFDAAKQLVKDPSVNPTGLDDILANYPYAKKFMDSVFGKYKDKILDNISMDPKELSKHMNNVYSFLCYLQSCESDIFNHYFKTEFSSLILKSIGWLALLARVDQANNIPQSTK